MNLYISENIRRLRRAKNITQERLAEHLGISTQAVSKWERGVSHS
ncbi:MAG: helix-turn-helix transcriptional regulator [Clostridia bacterium]|nr:helix-turn-helix transcriptional regulator [Clostridia bacterium]MBQ8370547.1 helix-turn-helix transcriptional regulator [Clostridia bacterium]